MDPLSGQLFRTNAFRTLGLSGLADQAAIQSAARRMRIWPDTENIPVTPWDLPELGPLSRSKMDIEKAVSALNHPTSRLGHRLLWYVTNDPPKAILPITPQANNLATPEGHVHIVSDLQYAFAINSKALIARQWQPIMAALLELSASVAIFDWQRQIEASGGFEIPASDKEISEAVNNLPTSLALAMVGMAQLALEKEDSNQLAEITAALRLGNNLPEVAEHFGELFDSLEDSLAVLCRQMDGDLRDKLRTNHSNPAPFYKRNMPWATSASKFYESRIRRQLAIITELAADEPHRLTRVRSTCAKELALLALGWEWSGKFRYAARTYTEAANLAHGTVLENQYRRDAERCRTSKKRRPVTTKTPRQRLVWIAAVIAITAVRGLMNVNSPDSKHIPEPEVPKFEIPNFNTPSMTPDQTTNLELRKILELNAAAAKRRGIDQTNPADPIGETNREP